MQRAALLALSASSVFLGCEREDLARTKAVVELAVEGEGEIRAAPSGATCPDACRLEHEAGTEVVLEAEPAAGHFFVGWTGACEDRGTETKCSFRHEDYVEAGATFAPVVPDFVELNVDVVGPGRVTSSPEGIDCTGGSCVAAFPWDTTVTLTATPDDGATFSGWGLACAGTGACVVQTNEEAVVRAEFE